MGELKFLTNTCEVSNLVIINLIIMYVIPGLYIVQIQVNIALPHRFLDALEELRFNYFSNTT